MVFNKKILILMVVTLFLIGCTVNTTNMMDDTSEDSMEDMMDDHMGEDVDMGQMLPGEEGSDMEEMMDDMMGEVDVTFELVGKNFQFDMGEEINPDLHVKVGDVVRIELFVEDGFHDWVIDEFNARTKQIKTGESDYIEFVADKAGTFEYYCSVGSHRAKGMKGNLIVEE